MTTITINIIPYVYEDVVNELGTAELDVVSHLYTAKEIVITTQWNRAVATQMIRDSIKSGLFEDVESGATYLIPRERILSVVIEDSEQ
jgi:hypothetical protein